MTLFAASILLGLLAGAWVAAPLVARRLALLGDPIPGGVIDAEARKRVALTALKEIEYDRIGGKLDEADYQRLRAQLEREAILALDAADRATGADDGAEPAAAESFTVTHSCGFANPPASRFCAGCGARLG